MGDIKIIGLEELEKRLKSNATLSDVKQKVRKNTLELQKKIVQNTGEETFNKGYFTDHLKQDVSASGVKFEDGGLTGSAGTTVEYGPYLEYGTRFMEKEPFIEPSLNEQKDKFIEDMRKLTK